MTAPAAVKTAPVLAGQVIKGKYRIERVLGAGGMGVVVEAHHVKLKQRFAIKFLLPAMLAHKDIVERFAREARAASLLESDHVARVVDVDTLEDGTPFMVMEFLEGNDLSSVRKQKRPLPSHVAVGYLLSACEALVEAHAAGIVHRDLKPANLFLAQRKDGKTRLKVLDFGISKMSEGDDASVTRTSAVMGSAEYMSPEQMLATKDVDARADIWSLGVTLYELLTATAPFPGTGIAQVAALVMSQTPQVPSSVVSTIPAGLDAVVMRCLVRDREERIGTVQELIVALEPFAAPASSTAPASSIEPAPSATNAASSPTSAEQERGDAPSTDQPAEAASRPTPAPEPVSAKASSTSSGTSNTLGDASSKPRRVPIAVMGVIGAVVVAAAAFALRFGSGTPSASSAPIAASSLPAATEAGPSANVSATAPAATSAAPVVVAPSASGSAAPSAAPPAEVSSRARRSSTPRPTATATAKPAKDPYGDR